MAVVSSELQEFKDLLTFLFSSQVGDLVKNLQQDIYNWSIIRNENYEGYQSFGMTFGLFGTLFLSKKLFSSFFWLNDILFSLA